MAERKNAADSQVSQIDAEIQLVNKQLSKVKLYKNKLGTKFMLRGYFPPHPGRPENSRERRASLALGIRVSKQGLKAAIAAAKQVDGQLLLNQFVWDPWLKPNERIPETIGEWVERLEKTHWEKTARTPDKEICWKKDYQCVFERLPKDQPLTLELLKEEILKQSEAGSRTRRRWTLACGKLADFAGLDGKVLRGLSTYNPVRSVKGRDLPSDEVIAEALTLCKTPGWRVVYILMAVFGLRDHEVLKCQFNRLDDDPPLIEVPENTKTGARLAYACFGDCWGDEFRIRSRDIVLPRVKNIETSSNLHLGRKVAQEFYECGVTAKVGKVYNLRHAWARRAFEHEWPVELAARAMGHDVRVHVDTYPSFVSFSRIGSM